MGSFSGPYELRIANEPLRGRLPSTETRTGSTDSQLGPGGYESMPKTKGQLSTARYKGSIGEGRGGG
jgi:hypothetical protein